MSCGNVVTLLRDGGGTFDAMLGLIESATQTLDFEGYIFRRDEIGDRFVKAFSDAADRGVRVRVLVDWLGRLPTPWSYFRGLQREGLDVRAFNPPGLRPWLDKSPMVVALGVARCADIPAARTAVRMTVSLAISSARRAGR